MLADAARRAGAFLPVMVMHDVGWPYGRRDLYYEPEQIPAEFRQPYDQRGMGRARKKLLPKGGGGLNPWMNNAETEGGPRNGVMTALDDFERANLREIVRGGVLAATSGVHLLEIRWTQEALDKALAEARE